MKKISLKNRKNQTLVWELRIPENNIKWVCIVQHGYSGSKSDKHVDKLAKAFFDNWFITFNFDATNSFNESDGEYEKATLQLHYEDLEDVVSWVKKQEWYQWKLALTWHSMGWYTVARYWEENPDKVDYIASIAPVVSGKLSWEAHKKFFPEKFENWEKTGWLIEESKSKPGLIKKSPWSHMLERLSHDLLKKAKNLTIPILLYVWWKDTICPKEHIKLLFDEIPWNKKQMIVNPNAPHTYRTEEDIKHLYNSVSDWVKRLL